ncbi:MAG: MotA/TolQ/ExbB proton channel family protein [Thiotrichales bacterium]
MINRFLKRTALTSIATCAAVFTLTAQPVFAADDLRTLVQEVKAQARSEAAHNKEREARFRSSLNERTKLMSEAQAEVARLTAQRDSLKATFEQNEIELGELEEQLTRRSGDLGELFGVFKQIANDTQSMTYDSLVSIDLPDRQAKIAALSEQKEVPDIEQMEALWEALLDEIALSGEVTRHTAQVVKPSGDTYESDVVRVGTFNAIAGDKYLRYLPENQQLVEFARQPKGYVTATAAKLSQASGEGVTGFALDPSRGVLLGLLVQSPSLIERIEQGKIVGYVIIAVAVIGLLIALFRLFDLSRISARVKKQRADLEHVDEDNPLGRVLAAYYQNKQFSVDVVSRKLEEVIFKEVANLRKGLPLLKVLAAIAPLLGLLGTVTGMIGTFQAITLFGTGDPKLMAGGISQALVTTVLGLVAAIPLLLLHSLLNSRATELAKVLGEQATGIVATQAQTMEAKRVIAQKKRENT